MFWGTGPAEVRLLRSDSTVEFFKVLPRPDRREEEDTPPVYDDYGANDSTGRRVRDLKGFRFVARYVWSFDELDMQDMADIIRISNWPGQIMLWPHQDVGLQFRCDVTSAPITPYNGSVDYDEVVIEFEGVDLLPTKPNPVYDNPSEHPLFSCFAPTTVFGQ